MPEPRIAMPMRARNPLNEVPDAGRPLPAVGAGTVGAAGAGVAPAFCGAGFFALVIAWFSRNLSVGSGKQP